MVKKIINYETTTYDRIWFKDMIVIAGDTYPESHNENWTGYEGEYYAELALENMTGFNPIQLYTSDGTFGGQRDVIRALNMGAGFVYFVGHGSPKVWGNHPPNESGFIQGLDVMNIHKLRNKNMYPICVVSGCHNNQFDVSLFNYLNFQAFYRGEAARESNAPGTGLGLTICREIVEIHEGDIGVDSQIGKGTTFHVCFPIKSEKLEILEVEKLESLPRGNERIIVVDDEPSIVNLQKAVLENLG